MRLIPLLLAAALAGAGPVPAGATGVPPGPGVPCTVRDNPFGVDGGSFYSMLMTGGPVVVADGTDPRSGRVVCTLRDFALTHADGLVNTEISSETSSGVVLLPPTEFAYWPSWEEPVVLCTRVEIDGAGTFYRDADNDVWSASPDVACERGRTIQIPPDEVLDVVDPVLDAVNEAIIEHVDPVLCAELGGDFYVIGFWVWDCPPYGEEPFPNGMPPGEGPPCSLHADPGGSGEGYVTAGPFLTVQETQPRPGRVTCTARSSGTTHATGTVAGRVTSDWGYGVVLLPPTRTAVSPTGLALCTQLELPGWRPFYWDASHDRWSTDPSVSCDVLAPVQ